jgi:hypothetical protein
MSWFGAIDLGKMVPQKYLGWHSNQKISHILNPFVFPDPNALDFIWVAMIIIKVSMCANLASIKLVLNRGIQQFNYCQKKRLPNKNMKVEPIFYLLIVMLQLPSYNNYCHATTIVMHISSLVNLKKDPQLPTNL